MISNLLKYFKRVCVTVLIAVFLSTNCAQSVSFAQMSTLMPQVGTMIGLTAPYVPPQLVGVEFDEVNPFRMSFLVNRGEKQLSLDKDNEEYMRFVKYFLASLTVSNKDQWVNLSPYEGHRIVEERFGKTAMGKDLLAQDYILKQLASSLVYPDGDIGKKFWSKVKEGIRAKYGSDVEIPLDMFNRVWIVPESADMYEDEGRVWIIKSHLKVMLEKDYVASSDFSENSHEKFQEMSEGEEYEGKAMGLMVSEVMREVVIPALEKEVNEGAHFSVLRQIYSAMILATWYKQNLKESILGQVYADKGKVEGISEKKNAQEGKKIYEQYVESFRLGAFDYIKEEYDSVQQEIIPRKYFSGGVQFDPSTLTPIIVNLKLKFKLLKEEYDALRRIKNNTKKDNKRLKWLTKELASINDDLHVFFATGDVMAIVSVSLSDEIHSYKKTLRELFQNEIEYVNNNINILESKSDKDKTRELWLYLDELYKVFRNISDYLPEGYQNTSPSSTFYKILDYINWVNIQSLMRGGEPVGGIPNIKNPKNPKNTPDKVVGNAIKEKDALVSLYDAVFLKRIPMDEILKTVNSDQHKSLFGKNGMIISRNKYKFMGMIYNRIESIKYYLNQVKEIKTSAYKKNSQDKIKELQRLKQVTEDNLRILTNLGNNLGEGEISFDKLLNSSVHNEFLRQIGILHREKHYFSNKQDLLYEINFFIKDYLIDIDALSKRISYLNNNVDLTITSSSSLIYVKELRSLIINGKMSIDEVSKLPTIYMKLAGTLGGTLNRKEEVIQAINNLIMNYPNNTSETSVDSSTIVEEVKPPQYSSDKTGGIDFDPSMLNMRIKRGRDKKPLDWKLQDPMMFDFSGLTPFIIDISLVGDDIFPDIDAFGVNFLDPKEGITNI